MAADSLAWKGGRVTADVQTWDLLTLLENIAGATGWDIYVEPKAKHQASTKFKERPPGEALRMLLGELSYILVPPTNGPGKLYVFRNSKGDATQAVRRKRSKRLENELIVAMKRGAKLDEKELGAKITGKIDSVNAYRLQFKDAQAAEEARKQLEENEAVDSVDANYAIARPPDAEQLSLSAIPSLDLNLKPNKAGEGPIIGLIDTAIQMPGDARDGFYLPPISVAGEAAVPPDVPTHGTSMGDALLRGLALGGDGSGSSNVRILPVDVYGNLPYTTSFNLVDGTVKALEGGADVINWSLGSDGENALLYRIIRAAAAEGKLFVGAAGNEPVTTPTYPAAYPEVIAVTAIERDGKVASYANRGPFIDAGASGVAFVYFDGKNFVSIGTSAATALTSGRAAAQLSAGSSPAAVTSKITGK